MCYLTSNTRYLVSGIWYLVSGIWYGIWCMVSGYLDIWVSGYLDSGTNNLLLHPHSEILCGAALPNAFYPGKNTFLVFLPRTIVFLEFYLSNL